MHRWWDDDQALAYLIAEQGRATSAELLARNLGTVDAARLWSAHEGFGLAAYHASEGMLEGVRPGLCLRVELAGPWRPPGVTGVEAALLLAIHGTAAVERCFRTLWLVPQMRTAHRGMRQAHVALTGLVGLGLAARCAAQERRAGRLARAWQAEHLRPGGPAAPARLAA
jgi:hypothetical protein